MFDSLKAETLAKQNDLITEQADQKDPLGIGFLHLIPVFIKRLKTQRGLKRIFFFLNQVNNNVTLTDDHLEVMFTTTDEETRQIEQPIEYLIERTKHKCKRFCRFFSNEAELKQHHCELPI